MSSEQVELRPYEGEALTRAAAAQLRKDIQITKGRLEEEYLRLAGLLFQVSDSGIWEDWGHESFEDYVDGELGFRYRKAAYLISIFRVMVQELGKDASDLRGIGWTKVGMLTGGASPVVDEENVDEWLSRARERSTTELQDDIRVARAQGEGGGDGGSSGEQDPADEPDERPQKMAFSLYGAQRANVELALELAQADAGSEKPGHLLDLICLAYCAGASAGAHETDTLEWWIGAMGTRFEVDVMAFKRGDPKALESQLKEALAELKK